MRSENVEDMRSVVVTQSTVVARELNGSNLCSKFLATSHAISAPMLLHTSRRVRFSSLVGWLTNSYVLWTKFSYLLASLIIPIA